MPQYSLYGLVIASDFPLPAPPVAESDPDITVRWGSLRAIPHEAPQGTSLLEFRRPQSSYFVGRVGNRLVIRYPGVCDAIVNETLDQIEIDCAHEEQRSFARVLFAGSVLSKVMMLAGRCVLHASAVKLEPGAFAFVGPPGSGKSTVAAMVCATGAPLITDDVLRLEPASDGWLCLPGVAQLRLRAPASSLASDLDGAVETTPDGRTAVSMPATGAPLAAIVFPQPSRTTTVVEVNRLNEEDALMRLTRYPRVIGWTDPDVLMRTFRWNARLAREVGAYEATIPWGPPFSADTATELLRLLTSRQP